MSKTDSCEYVVLKCKQTLNWSSSETELLLLKCSNAQRPFHSAWEKLNKQTCVPGFITDGNSKLVGNARLRQLRVQKNSCEISGFMLQLVPDCNAPYSWEVEDMGSYGPGWNPSVEGNTSTSTSSPWKYQTQAQLRSYPIWGKMALYRAGGFVAELGPDLQNASRYVHQQTGRHQ